MQVRWPPPPDPVRFFYEATLRGNRDIEVLDREQKLKLTLVGDTRPKIGMTKPYDVAARKGRIYVTDSLGQVVHAFDIPRRRYYQFGYRREGALKVPHGIAVDTIGRVYVTDSKARRVVIYDPLGLYLGSVGSASDLDRPTGLAVSPSGDRIYVVDTGGVESERHRVVVYSPDGSVLRTIGTRGKKPGEFNLPTDVEVDGEGNLYVLDAGNFRVQIIDPEGQPIRAFGSVGNGFGQFARPKGLTLDAQGNIYVSDASFANVQIFNRQGQLLLPIGNKQIEDGPGHLALPAGLDIDETGRIYIVDQLFRKLEVIRPARLNAPS
ncbi:MAG: hypothetical protein Kow006_09610 [Gammaproteobacteria bacterium]